MRKALFLTIAVALLAVAAGCGGEEPPPTSNVPTLVVTPTVPTATTPPATTEPGQAVCRAAPPVGTVAEGLPPVTDQDWIRGPADAPITMIEYADFQ
ncbi:MAG TPA: hypothetical protein EYH30_03805 [Anaerolineales bacterium]|nr:hypothetical protein [Anaerolineae bacterium]HIQ01246.1 hypothetical protein [Anaerolineales bacterium]